MSRMECDGTLVLFSQLVWLLRYASSQSSLTASTRVSTLPTGHSGWPDETFTNDSSASYQTTNEIRDPRNRLATKLNRGGTKYRIMEEQKVANDSENRMKRGNQRDLGFIQSNLGNTPEMKQIERPFESNILKAYIAKFLSDKRYKLFSQEEPDKDKIISQAQQTDQNQPIKSNVKSDIQNHFDKTFDSPQEKIKSKSSLYPLISRKVGHNFASSSSFIVNTANESEAYKYPTLTTNRSRFASEKSILQEHGHAEDSFGRMSEINSPPYESPAQKKSSSVLGLLPVGVISTQQSSASVQNPSLLPRISPVFSSRIPERQVQPFSPLEFIDHHSSSSPTNDDKIFELLSKGWSNLNAPLSTPNSNIGSEAQSNSLQTTFNSALQSEQSNLTSDLLFLDSNDILAMSSALSGLFQIGGIGHENPAPQDVNTVISPQALSNMLLRLQVPSVGELAQAVPVTRFTPELVDAIANFIDNISEALMQLLTDLQAIFNDNPLLAALLAISLFALLWHFFHKGKKKKGHGYGHHQDGYHRSWQPQFRRLDDYGQKLTLKVLSHLEGFGDWLNTTGRHMEHLQ